MSLLKQTVMEVTHTELSIGSGQTNYREVTFEFHGDSYISCGKHFSSLYNSIMNEYCTMYNGDQLLMWHSYNIAETDPSFLVWLQQNKFVYCMYSGFIMEGKTESLARAMDNDTISDYDKLCMTPNIIKLLIRETDELWRAKNYKSTKTLLEHPEDHYMIRFLWISAYMKQLYNHYINYKDVTDCTFLVFTDRASIDHDIFDHAYDDKPVFEHTLELIVEHKFKYTTAVLARLLCESLPSTKFTFYLKRVAKRVPWPVEYRVGREFEHGFYTDRIKFEAIQRKFYTILDMCLGIPFQYDSWFQSLELPGPASNNFQLQPDLEHLNLNILSCIGQINIASGDYIATFNAYQALYKHVAVAMRVYGVLAGSHKKAWFKIVKKVGLDVDNEILKPNGLMKKRKRSCDVVSLCGFWGTGKTEYLDKSGANLKIYECSDLWRFIPKMLEHPAIMYGAWLCIIYNKLSKIDIDVYFSNHDTDKHINVALDRSPLCFAGFYMLKMGVSFNQIDTYMKAFRALFSLHFYRVTTKIVWHENVAMLPWPIKESRALERIQYPTSLCLSNNKFMFFKFLELNNITFPIEYIDEKFKDATREYIDFRPTGCPN
jgi:hypothetical protein